MKWVVAAVLAAGCYRPVPPEGAPCSATHECPSGLACIDNVCVHPGGGSIDAARGSMDAADARIDGASAMLVPSNGVDASAALTIAGAITLTGNTRFRSDGRITGAFARPSGTGVINGIGFEVETFMGVELAVYSFGSLSIAQGANITFDSAMPYVFVVGRDATIGGVIDVSASCSAGNCPGPGGGAGTIYSATGGGCGGGAGGANMGQADSGGGGAGGGAPGGKGANDTRSTENAAGGAGGSACMPSTLEPLTGGSGGAGGGPGGVSGTIGGAGGGALQLTVFGTLTIAGTIDASGAGGSPGPGDATNSNAGGGAGGGGGGGILLEARTLDINGIVVANGGGGGGAGYNANAGSPGEHGHRDATPAAGGAGAMTNSGGNGGALASPAAAATDSTTNGGGGGGAVGRIYLRSIDPPILSGTISPAPGVVSI